MTTRVVNVCQFMLNICKNGWRWRHLWHNCYCCLLLFLSCGSRRTYSNSLSEKSLLGMIFWNVAKIGRISSTGAGATVGRPQISSIFSNVNTLSSLIICWEWLDHILLDKYRLFLTSYGNLSTHTICAVPLAIQSCGTACRGKNDVTCRTAVDQCEHSLTHSDYAYTIKPRPHRRQCRMILSTTSNVASTLLLVWTWLNIYIVTANNVHRLVVGADWPLLPTPVTWCHNSYPLCSFVLLLCISRAFSFHFFGIRGPIYKKS